jgi:S-adenosylmethionine hydrolase
LPGLITLISDFGIRDPFAGIMKGVILGIDPQARLVDLTHQVESYDILEGALALAQSYPYFPAGTIHLVVVDPGVGSERRAIVLSTGAAHFVGPDNGVFELVYQREPGFEVRHITSKEYLRSSVSQTFHGRDIFAPVAGWLSTGVAAEKLGPVVPDYVRLQVPRPEPTSAGQVRGTVLRIDKFGNLITNLTAEHLPARESFLLLVGGRRVTRLVTSYSAGVPGETFAILGSAGFLEIAARQASAAELLQVSRGSEVNLLNTTP